jgi:hypothetical protein
MDCLENHGEQRRPPRALRGLYRRAAARRRAFAAEPPARENLVDADPAFEYQ